MSDRAYEGHVLYASSRLGEGIRVSWVTIEHTPGRKGMVGQKRRYFALSTDSMLLRPGLICPVCSHQIPCLIQLSGGTACPVCWQMIESDAEGCPSHDPGLVTQEV